MRSDTTIQPSVTSPSRVSQCLTVDQQVMDQFAQMQSILSSFLRLREETARTPFCNYLAPDVEALEDRDFQTFRNKAVKLLGGIQSRAEERTYQPLPPHQHTLSRSSSATFTTAIATSTRWSGKHLNYSRDSDITKPGHPASSAEPSGTQSTATTQRAASFLHNC